jgi:hypothetical protein
MQPYQQNPQRNHYNTDLSNVFVKDFEIPKLTINVDEIPFITSGYSGSHRYDNGNMLIYGAYNEDNQDWEPDCPQFIKDMYDLAWNYFLEIDPSAKVTSVTRVLLNRTVNDGTMRTPEVHQDRYYFRKTWSILIHLDGTSGDTEFYDTMIFQNKIKTIPFKPGRITIFPAAYAHTGQLPNDDNPRHVINVLIIVETELNTRVNLP